MKDEEKTKGQLIKKWQSCANGLPSWKQQKPSRCGRREEMLRS